MFLPPVPVVEKSPVKNGVLEFTFAWQQWFQSIYQTLFSEVLRATYAARLTGNLTLDDTYDTVVATVTGTTVTLPAAATHRIGHTWTIILGVAGYVDITRAGTDTIVLPTADTTIRLTTMGASVTLRCLSTSTWGIV